MLSVLGTIGVHRIVLCCALPISPVGHGSPVKHGSPVVHGSPVSHGIPVDHGSRTFESLEKTTEAIRKHEI